MTHPVPQTAHIPAGRRIFHILTGALAFLLVVSALPAFSAEDNPDYLKGKKAYDEKDYDSAVRFYKKAAEQGLAEAQYNLGLAYLKGTGISKDKEEGEKWLWKAAEAGSDSAKEILEQLILLH